MLTHRVRAEGITALSASKIHSIYLVAPIGFNDKQNTMRGFIWSYTRTLNMIIHIKDNNWTKVIIFTIIQNTFAKLGG